MITTSADAHPIAEDHRSAVQVSRWPHIPTEEREVAEIIANSLRHLRNGEPASVLHEESLSEDVSTAIDRAIELPQSSGLPLSVVSELARNERYRTTT